MHKFIFFLALIFYSASNLANERALTETAKQVGTTVDDIKENLKSCNGSQMQINVCAQYQLVAHEIVLKDKYKQLIKQLGESIYKEKLLISHKSWENYVKKDCDYESSPVGGGSLEPMRSMNCKKKHTKERIKRLNEFLACQLPGCPGNW